MKKLALFSILAVCAISAPTFADNCGSGATYLLVQTADSIDSSADPTDEIKTGSGQDTLFKLDHPNSLASVSLDSPGYHVCGAYNPTSSWVAYTPYSGATMSSEFWSFVHPSGTLPMRLPMGTLVATSGGTRANRATKLSNVAMVWDLNDSSGNHNGWPCSLAGVNYYHVCAW